MTIFIKSILVWRSDHDPKHLPKHDNLDMAVNSMFDLEFISYWVDFSDVGFFWPRIFLTQYFSDHRFFWPCFFQTMDFSDPGFFWPCFFLTMDFSDPELFWSWIFLTLVFSDTGLKSIVRKKTGSEKTRVRKNQGQKNLGSEIFFDHRLFWPCNFLTLDFSD